MCQVNVDQFLIVTRFIQLNVLVNTSLALDDFSRNPLLHFALMSFRINQIVSFEFSFCGIITSVKIDNFLCIRWENPLHWFMKSIVIRIDLLRNRSPGVIPRKVIFVDVEH